MNITQPDGSTPINMIFPRHESLSSQVFGAQSPLSNLLTPGHGKQEFIHCTWRQILHYWESRDEKLKMALPEADPVTDSTRVTLVNTDKQSQAWEEDWGTGTEEEDVQGGA